MGVMRRWLTWWVAGGLFSVFVAHRVFHGMVWARLPLSVLGFAAVFGGAAWRVRSWLRAGAEERPIERAFAFAYVGCAVALVGFMVGTEDGVRWLGLEFGDSLVDLRFRRGFLIGSTIALAASFLPAAAAQWALRFGGGEEPGALRIESLRVVESATNALSVALAGAFVLVGGYVTAAHDKTFDASYFKTSRPGSAVQEIVRNQGEPLRVLLFFPEVNPVKDEVANYFRELNGATDNVVVESFDRLSRPQVAAEHDVQADGTVLLLRGERRERLGISPELATARVRLRLLDGDVQGALLRLQRPPLIAYLTVGHDELNDPFRRGATPTNDTLPPLAALRGLLELMSFEVRELGLRTGLGNRIPDDAAVLLAVGPQRPFLDEEMAVVQEYLDRGGSLLLALEPGSEFNLEGLRDRLGVDFGSIPLADDQRHVRQTGSLSDRRLLVTDRFTAHASVTTAGRRGVGSAILFAGPGYLTAAADVEGPRTSFVVQSMPTTFADENGNLQLDEGSESRRSFDLVAAIEGPAQGDGGAMRSLVYADADMFSDGVLASLGMNAAVVADGLRWLGREEAFSGETVSEADVPIVHTRAEDVAWFYAIIFGAPALVLAGGLLHLFGTGAARKREVAS
jgi:hypothetical protein